MEGEAEDLDEKINGIAGHVAFRPAPVGVLYDETGIGGQYKITRLACDELESVFLQQRHERSQTRGADLLARPAGIRQWDYA